MMMMIMELEQLQLERDVSDCVAVSNCKLLTLKSPLLETGSRWYACGSKIIAWARPGVEKVSDHGTIGPRKYFGSQKEKDQT